jgi:hypothetical protein
MSDTYLEHIWVDISRRTVKIMDSEGVDEVVQWKFDEEGSEGFSETLMTFNENVPSELITYV